MTTQTLSQLDQLCGVYQSMIDRCYYPKCSTFKWYGGKGVTVFKHWIKNKLMFIRWCLKNGWEPGLQLDRIDNDKGYHPSNIRFVTRMTNLGNRGHGDGSQGFNGRRYKLPMNVTINGPSRYKVIIAREGVRRYVGCFKTVGEAVKARDEAITQLEKEVYGH